MIPGDDLRLALAARAQGLIDDAQLVELAYRAGSTGGRLEALMVSGGMVDAETLARLQFDLAPQTLDYNARHLIGTLVQPHDLSFEGTLAPDQTLDPPSPATATGQHEILSLAPDQEAFTQRYRVLEELGRGGAGVVVAAEDRLMGRQVALKIIHAADATQRVKARFFAEAQTTAQLEHPNVVPVHEIGTNADGRPYFSMELVRGRSLKSLLEALDAGDAGLVERFTRFRLLQLFNQVCLGVDYAHAKGVIHRDIKPDNIMIGDFGEALVMDWGIAKVLEEAAPVARPPLDEAMLHTLSDQPVAITGESAQTQAGAVFGTPGYMAPEQALGEIDMVDRRTDVWALGAVLYELLTGSSPHQAASPMALLMATIQQPVQPPRERAPDRDIPADLEEICMRALQRDREDRYPTARALHDDIERHLNGARERVRRAEEAHRLVQEGQETLWYTTMLAEEVSDLSGQIDEAPPLPTQAPLEEKRARWALEDRCSRLEGELAEAYTWAERKFAQALELLSDHEEARRQMALMHWTLYRQARARFDSQAARRHISAVSRYNNGDFSDRLARTAPLSLTTEPAGAQITLYRYVERDRQLVPMQPRAFGQTPLTDHPMPVGRVLLEIGAEGRSPVRLPVTAWQGDELAFEVTLPSAELHDEGFVYIPGGTFLRGHDPQAVMPLPSGLVHLDGFAISALPVTCEEYRSFLNALPGEIAMAHVPREQDPLWRTDAHGAWQIPEADDEGDRWLPDWPVINVSAEDAEAYCRWRTAETGVLHRLPTEDEWEKAARGTDGRLFPWGDHFDPTFCCIRGSVEGPPTPQPVGRFAADVSPYGVHDMAGGVREWTASWFDEQQRTVRGGSWNLYAFLCHPAGRFGQYPTTRLSSIGFRVVREV